MNRTYLLQVFGKEGEVGAINKLCLNHAKRSQWLFAFVQRGDAKVEKSVVIGCCTRHIWFAHGNENKAHKHTEYIVWHQIKAFIYDATIDLE